MKLEKLTIDDFLGIPHADLDLSAPVTVILGDNGNGKSSVKDALEFIFSGGVVESRGYTKKNQAEALQHAGGGKMSVSLIADGKTYSRTAKSGHSPALDPDLAVIAVNPQRVLRLSAKERQGIFGSILSKPDTSAKIIKRLGELGFDYNEKEIADLDKLQKEAIQNRRDAKNTVENLTQQTASKPAEQIEIAGQSFSLADWPTDKIGGLIAERTRTRDDAQRKLGAAQKELAEIGEPPVVTGLNEMRLELVKQLKDAQSATNSKIIDSFRTEVARADDVVRGKQRFVDMAKTALDTINRSIDSINKMTGTCPTCQRKLTKESKVAVVAELEAQKLAKTSELRNLEDGLHDAMGLQQDAQTKYESAIAQQKTDAEQIAGIEQNIRDIDDLVRKAARHPVLLESVESLKKEIETLDAKLANLNTLKNASVAYMAYETANKQTDENIRAGTETIKRMDLLDQLLKPDGEIRQLANEDLAAAQFDMALAEAWGMESLALGPDGMITLFGRPIEAASQSEQYRAGVLLAELLSRELKLGILVLDGLDILSNQTRAALNDRLAEWTETFESIILLRTVSERPEVDTAGDWLKSYWVETGRVELIEKAAEVTCTNS